MFVLLDERGSRGLHLNYKWAGYQPAAAFQAALYILSNQLKIKGYVSTIARIAGLAALASLGVAVWFSIVLARADSYFRQATPASVQRAVKSLRATPNI